MRNQATHQELTDPVVTTAAETRVGIAIAVEPLLQTSFTQLKTGNRAASFDVSYWAGSAYLTDVEAELAGDAVSPRGVRSRRRRTLLDVFYIITRPTDCVHEYFATDRGRMADCG